MSSPNPTAEEDASPEPETPFKTEGISNDDSSKGEPKSAPAAIRGRPRSNTTKPPPTLLNDFLLGRPSPARISADRHRRMSLEAVKAELRHEMKQSAVQRLQPPGGVKDRVKKWQKTNAAAIAAGEAADEAATEPSDVAFKDDDFRSVNEEDRVRIKMRKKVRRPSTKTKETPEKREEPVPEPTPTKPPPKRRVISDSHWRKNREFAAKTSSNKTTPTGAPLPKDFVARNSANPSVSNKVKSWASKVEIPEPSTPRSHRSSKSVGASWHEDTESQLFSDAGETVSEMTRSQPGSRVTEQRSATSVPGADDGIRITPIRRRKPANDGANTGKSAATDDGIRVRPMSEVSSEAGTSKPGSIRTARLKLKSAPTSRRPSRHSESRSDVSKIQNTSDLSAQVIEVIEGSDLSKTTRTDDRTDLSRSQAAPGRSQVIEVIEDDESFLATPTKRSGASGGKGQPRSKSYHHGAINHKDDEIYVDEDKSILEPSQLEESDLSSSILAKSIADIPGEIPWGNSAFTELDLPLRGGPPRSRPKRPAAPNRNTSFKSMPKVFKKVMEEGKKIIHDMNEPQRPAGPNNPPSIEKWLNNTVDPFVDVDEPKTEPIVTPQEEVTVNPMSPESHSRRKPSQATRRKASAAKREKQETEEKPPAAVIKTPAAPEHTPAPKPKGPPQQEAEVVPEPQPEPVKEPEPEHPPKSKPEPARDVKEDSPPKLKRASTKPPTKLPSASGLKRARATRGNASPIKIGTKAQLLGMLKQAFQGESGNQLPKPKPYQSQEERRYGDEEESMYTDSRYDDERTYTYDDDDDYTEDWEESDLSKRRSSRGPRSDSPEEQGNQHRVHDEQVDPSLPRMLGPRFRPPTNGHHELSTILSEEDSSAGDSDLTSDAPQSSLTQSTLTQSTLTQSTLTQSTVLTKDSGLSKTASQRSQGPGLKRRLTRHSDLISVLSLPDNTNIPDAIKSNRSRPSIRKSRGGPNNNVTTDDLLREFAEDEILYLRELKTLIDGVIPVLLTQVVNNNNVSALFGSNSPATKADGLSKSVINMGVALEKLRMAHRKAPISDMRRLATWGHGVVPIYHKYLDAWRLGFQDLIVNLAPASGNPEDEDSLIGAMPRNESGDIIDSNGERVDVAHLLKRPILRLKQMAKFIKCVDSIIGTNDSYDLMRDFENLQDKARRRHREETARLIDEDAINTDTTRSRDLRTFAPLDSVIIDANRQVSAKDLFSLDLAHSNGQRLECQVELVHRDNVRYSEDKGDLLIRENGERGRSFLLFPPIPMELISARTGEGYFDMVVMIRGTHNDRPWHELLTLTADNEDQILDWLDILPVSPVPPREPEPSIIGDDDEESPSFDVPVGARSLHQYSKRSSRSPRSPINELPPASPTTPTKRPLPTRYRPRSVVVSPPPTTSVPGYQDGERTPTQYSYQPDARNAPMAYNMYPDPLNFERCHSSNSYREDGAPPPPVHRTLSPGPSPNRQSTPKQKPNKPPVDLASSARVKRRTSSPLKHEYLPSDGSSVSGASLTADTEHTSDYSETESDFDSSDDELDSIGLPETEIGVSIRDEPPQPPPIQESVVSDVSQSACSLTPSNSASQAGLHSRKTAPEENAQRYTASISRWSDKGMWKDVSPGNCSVIITPGLIEAHAMPTGAGAQGHDEKPLLALDLTPLVLIRQSTAVDLEIRSAVRPDCQLASSHGGGNFRFRCHNGPDCYNLYMSVHHARLNNQKFIQLENEARFKSFGERQAPADNDATSSKRRSWFGRKNSYRGSVRAPSKSHDGASTTPSSSLSATSFLKRLTGGGNLSFNLARSSVDRQSRYDASSHTPGSSSYGGATPRSPSISVENSGHGPASFDTEDIKIRLHLLVSAAKWEDNGNCRLSIRRPPSGWHQALRADHGLEKRITVTTIPRKKSEQPVVLLDAVLGSGCFSLMGSRGIVCGVWEEMKDHNGVIGAVPATGPTGGNVKKWCFQCASVTEASWVLRLVHQEVMVG